MILVVLTDAHCMLTDINYSANLNHHHSVACALMIIIRLKIITVLMIVRMQMIRIGVINDHYCAYS